MDRIFKFKYKLFKIFAFGGELIAITNGDYSNITTGICQSGSKWS